MSILKLSMICALTMAMSLTNALTLADKGGHGGGHGGHGHGEHGKFFHHGPRGNQGKAFRSHEKGASALAKANKKARFSESNRATITNYIRQNPFPATSLPPGIAMNVARGKALPPGIAKRFLPTPLVEQLPVYPGYDYVAVGNDVVLVNSNTGVVADILSNVLQ